MKKLLMAAGVAAAALALAAPANAETVNLSGSVSQICNVTPGTTNVNFGNLGAQGVESPISFNYTLHCNVNWDAALSSLNGRLENQNVVSGTIGPETGAGAHAYNGSSDFFAALDYTIDPSFSSAISSASFNAGSVFSATGLPPTNTAYSLQFDTVELTGAQELVAGSYSDTITLTITPQGL